MRMTLRITQSVQSRSLSPSLCCPGKCNLRRRLWSSQSRRRDSSNASSVGCASRTRPCTCSPTRTPGMLAALRCSRPTQLPHHFRHMKPRVARLFRCRECHCQGRARVWPNLYGALHVYSAHQLSTEVGIELVDSDEVSAVRRMARRCFSMAQELLD